MSESHRTEFAELLEKMHRLGFEAGRLAGQLEGHYGHALVLQGTSAPEPDLLGIVATVGAEHQRRVKPQGERRNGRRAEGLSKAHALRTALKTVLREAEGRTLDPKTIRERMGAKLGTPVVPMDVQKALRMPLKNHEVERTDEGYRLAVSLA